MIGESYRCDVCGRPKGVTNHWFLSIPRRIWEEPGEPAALLFVLAAWDELAAQEPGIAHLCGEGCALKALSRALAEATASSAVQEGGGDAVL